MPVKVAPIKAALTGNNLVDALNKSTDQIRGDAGIRLKADIALNTEGEAAYRYYGKTLPQAVSGAGELLRAGQPGGVFPGLGFTYEDYVQAQTRADDTAKAEAKIRALSTDASAEAKDARDKLAGMTFQIQRSMEYVQASPAADPAHKAIITANGAHFNDALTERRNMIMESRHVNAEHRATVAANGALTAENHTLSTQAAVNAAQLKLQLQSLTGQGLTPRDLVVTPAEVGAPADAQPAPHPHHATSHHRPAAAPAPALAQRARAR